MGEQLRRQNRLGKPIGQVRSCSMWEFVANNLLIFEDQIPDSTRFYQIHMVQENYYDDGQQVNQILTSSDSSLASSFSSTLASSTLAAAAPPPPPEETTTPPPPPDGTDANFSLPEAITSRISLFSSSLSRNAILSLSASAPTAQRKMRT